MRSALPAIGLRRTLVSACLAFGVLVTGLGVASAPAEARGHVFVGVGFGGYGYGPWVPPPVYYAPPPVYYAPPPVYYTQPAPQPQAPVYYNPNTGNYDSGGDIAPASAPVREAPAAPSFDTSNCQPYHSTAVLDGVRQSVAGTACKQPDGSWHMMN